MKYTDLGRTGLCVSRLCLGTMNFGPHTSEADSFAIMDRALELGINFFDTANVYGWKIGEGHHRADRRALVRAGRRAAREGSCSPPRSTDAWATGRTTAASRPTTSGRPARTACAGCRPTTSTSTRCTTSTATRRGRRSGRRWSGWSSRARSLYVGSSNFAGWHIARRRPPRRSRHFMGLVSEQSLYNLDARTIELEVIPACRALRPRPDPLEPARRRPAGRRAREGDRRPARRPSSSQKRIEKHRAQLEAYEKLCARAGRAARRRRARLAAAQPGRDRADHRPAHDRAAHRQPARARDQADAPRCSRSSTRSGPAPAAKRPKRTPGSRDEHTKRHA